MLMYLSVSFEMIRSEPSHMMSVSKLKEIKDNKGYVIREGKQGAGYQTRRLLTGPVAGPLSYSLCSCCERNWGNRL